MIFRGVLEATALEDGGKAMIAELADDVAEAEPCMFIRVQSWDESAEHVALKSLIGRRVKITVEAE